MTVNPLGLLMVLTSERPCRMSATTSHVSGRRTPNALTRKLLLATALFALTACADDTTLDAPANATAATPLEPQWSVGGANDTTLIFDRLSVNDIAVDAQHRLLVIERTGGRIAVLDSLGVLMDTWGNPGPGPGELEFPLTLAVAPDGTTHVYDSAKRQFVVFSPDGTFLEQRERARGHPFRFHFISDSAVVGTTSGGRGWGRRLLLQRGVSWDSLAVTPARESRSTPAVCRLTDYPVAPIFSEELAWDARRDTVAFSTGDFSIVLRVGGSARPTLSRDTARRAATPALARREIGEGETVQLQGMKPCLVPAEMILEVADIAEEIPAYEALTLAPDGFVWATRDLLPDEPAVADLYHMDHGFLRTVPLGSARPVTFLAPRMLISVETDADDVPRVVAYHVPESVLTLPVTDESSPE